MGLFKKRAYISIPTVHAVDKMAIVPEGLWNKCPKCETIVYLPDLTEYKCCSQCQYHYRLTTHERLKLTVDTESFKEWLHHVSVKNPLSYPKYEEKLAHLKMSTDVDEAVTIGKATVNGFPLAIGIMDTAFIMGSMGSVVGEKITYLFEEATRMKLPVVLFCASGGARMQEGILSLMQMAKVSTAVANHHAVGLFYVSVLTDPTTGGVTASFAMEADVIVAEPQATVGFAGKRVIEQTIKEALPDGFQSAETVQKNGFIDCIVPRKEMRLFLAQLLLLHQGGIK